MFGLFGSKQDAQKAYEELLAYLTDDWEMKGRYAGAFLEAYRRSISKIYAEVMKRYGAIANSGNAELQLMTAAMGGKNDAMDHILVAQAYRAYKDDLLSGRHVGTDVEVAIWAILSNRSDVLEQIDKSLARYIDKEQEVRFPKLLEEVFRVAGREDPLPDAQVQPNPPLPRALATDTLRPVQQGLQAFLCPECGSREEGDTEFLG